MKLSTFTKLTAFTLLFCGLNEVSNAQSWDLSTQINGNDTIADDVKLVTTDNTGNSYWASHFYIKNSNREGFMISKIDKTGILLIRKAVQHNSINFTITGIKDIKFISGSVYVVSDARKTGADVDVVIQKYNSSLTKLWEVVYNDVNSKDDAGIQLAEGPNNGVLVSMISFEDGAVFNYSKINGNIISSMIYNNGATNRETIRKMIYSAGSVYIAGKNSNLAGTNSDMFIARFDSNLVQVWNKVFDASGNTLADEIIDINPDAAGDILVTGNYTMTNTSNSVFYTKYNDVNGSRLWLRRLTNVDIFATAVFADASSNVISVTNGGPNRYVNLNGSTGSLIANKGIFNVGNVNYEITDVKSSGSDLFVTGNYDSLSTNVPQQVYSGVLVTKLASGGARSWNETKISLNATLYHRASCLGIRNGSRLYYAANLFDSTNPTKRYYTDLSSIAASNGARIADAGAATNIHVFPNPASEYLSIQFNAEADGMRVAELYDMNGRQIISEVISGTEASLTHIIAVQELNKGLYLLRVTDGSTFTVTKVIIE